MRFRLFGLEQLLLCVLVALHLVSSCDGSWLTKLCLSRVQTPRNLSLKCFKQYTHRTMDPVNFSVICDEAEVRWTESIIKARVHKFVYSKDARLRRPYTCISMQIHQYYFSMGKQVYYRDDKGPKIPSHKERLYCATNYRLLGCLYGGKPVITNQYHHKFDYTFNRSRNLRYCDYNLCNDKYLSSYVPPTRKRKLLDWPEPTGSMAKVYDSEIIANPGDEIHFTYYCEPEEKCDPPEGTGTLEMKPGREYIGRLNKLNSYLPKACPEFPMKTNTRH